MQRFVVKKQYIGQLELLGALVVYCSWPIIERAAGRKLPRRVIHFIDNTSALSGLIKGYSSLPDSARLAYAYHCLLFYLQISVWNSFVATSANVGDMPTRLEKENFRHYLAFVLFATKVNLVLPPLDAWNAAFSHWATYASSSPSA